MGLSLFIADSACFYHYWFLTSVSFSWFLLHLLDGPPVFLLNTVSSRFFFFYHFLVDVCRSTD